MLLYLLMAIIILKLVFMDRFINFLFLFADIFMCDTKVTKTYTWIYVIYSYVIYIKKNN